MVISLKITQLNPNVWRTRGPLGHTVHAKNRNKHALPFENQVMLWLFRKVPQELEPALQIRHTDPTAGHQLRRMNHNTVHDILQSQPCRSGTLTQQQVISLEVVQDHLHDIHQVLQMRHTDPTAGHQLKSGTGPLLEIRQKIVDSGKFCPIQRSMRVFPDFLFLSSLVDFPCLPADFPLI